jgi:hypothetical protein
MRLSKSRSEQQAMRAFLKIENIGVCPPEGFTVLGVSLADKASHQGVIGQFGSGNKHGVALLLRHGLSPVVFAGTLRLEFGTRPQTVADSQARKEFSRVFVKYGGTDPITGSSRSSTEDLGFVMSYGEKDWTEVALALREFVSNAIDRSIREWGDWSGVSVEIVNDNQVRARAGYTRVFVPLNGEAFSFYENIGKWFLHFSEPESLRLAILPKKNRNLGERKTAVIYRKGVRVREWSASDTESLFDYNLNNLSIDEARKASDWDVKFYSGRALANADKRTLAILFEQILNSTSPAWELTFDACALTPSNRDKAEDVIRRCQTWREAFIQVAGDHGVITGAGTVEQLKRKGYKPVVAAENLVTAAMAYGVSTPASVLSADDLAGREITEPSPDALAAVDLVWDVIEEAGLTNGKTKPPVKCFTSILDGGVMLNGYYRNGEVFINSDLAGGSSAFAGPQALSDRLVKVALEEVAHHVTQATDCSRDFQDYLLDLAVKLARRSANPFLNASHAGVQ